MTHCVIADTCSVSYLEIYNEVVYDLLATLPDENDDVTMMSSSKPSSLSIAEVYYTLICVGVSYISVDVLMDTNTTMLPNLLELLYCSGNNSYIILVYYNVRP